jgi:hypothetical protein
MNSSHANHLPMNQTRDQPTQLKRKDWEVHDRIRSKLAKREPSFLNLRRTHIDRVVRLTKHLPVETLYAFLSVYDEWLQTAPDDHELVDAAAAVLLAARETGQSDITSESIADNLSAKEVEGELHEKEIYKKCGSIKKALKRHKDPRPHKMVSDILDGRWNPEYMQIVFHWICLNALAAPDLMDTKMRTLVYVVSKLTIQILRFSDDQLRGEKNEVLEEIRQELSEIEESKEVEKRVLQAVMDSRKMLPQAYRTYDHRRWLNVASKLYEVVGVRPLPGM